MSDDFGHYEPNEFYMTFNQSIELSKILYSDFDIDQYKSDLETGVFWEKNPNLAPWIIDGEVVGIKKI